MDFRFRSQLVGETPDPRVTRERRVPQVHREPKASKVSQVFRDLQVLKAPKDLRAHPARRVTKERRAKLQP